MINTIHLAAPSSPMGTNKSNVFVEASRLYGHYFRLDILLPGQRNLFGNQTVAQK